MVRKAWSQEVEAALGTLHHIRPCSFWTKNWWWEVLVVIDMSVLWGAGRGIELKFQNSKSPVNNLWKVYTKHNKRQFIR